MQSPWSLLKQSLRSIPCFHTLSQVWGVPRVCSSMFQCTSVWRGPSAYIDSQNGNHVSNVLRRVPITFQHLLAHICITCSLLLRGSFGMCKKGNIHPMNTNDITITKLAGCSSKPANPTSFPEHAANWSDNKGSAACYAGPCLNQASKTSPRHSTNASLVSRRCLCWRWSLCEAECNIDNTSIYFVGFSI